MNRTCNATRGLVRLAVFVTLACLLLAAPFARAEQTVPAVAGSRERAFPTGGLSAEDAIEGYIHQTMYFQTNRYAQPRSYSRLSQRLPDAESRLYEALKAKIVQVARGELSSTAFEIPIKDIYDDVHYTAEDLGVASPGGEWQNFGGGPERLLR